VLRHHAPERWKKDRVFARLVRLVHPDELLQQIPKPASALRVFQGLRRGKARDLLGDAASRLVLRAQHLREIGQAPGLLEPREQVILLELLVVVLDERADDVGATAHRLRREVVPHIDPTDRFTVHEQHALQHAVLPHQILGRRDLFLRFAFAGLGAARALRAFRHCRNEQTRAGDPAGAQEGTSVGALEEKLIQAGHHWPPS
jgi:hypothetical protein